MSGREGHWSSPPSSSSSVVLFTAGSALGKTRSSFRAENRSGAVEELVQRFWAHCSIWSMCLTCSRPPPTSKALRRRARKRGVELRSTPLRCALRKTFFATARIWYRRRPRRRCATRPSRMVANIPSVATTASRRSARWSRLQAATTLPCCSSAAIATRTDLPRTRCGAVRHTSWKRRKVTWGLGTGRRMKVSRASATRARPSAGGRVVAWGMTSVVMMWRRCAALTACGRPLGSETLLGWSAPITARGREAARAEGPSPSSSARHPPHRRVGGMVFPFRVAPPLLLLPPPSPSTPMKYRDC
eukprot:Sspe_Gene.43049::Locus_20929_Transcript_1_1_Confidence_1.000_Length_1428::g.43049::m.43049